MNQLYIRLNQLLSSFHELLIAEFILVVVIFGLFYFAFNFFISIFWKIKESDVKQVKDNTFKIFLVISAGLLVCAVVQFSSYLNISKFQFFLLILFAIGELILVSYFASRMLEHEYIEYAEKGIEKEQTADGIGTLLEGLELGEGKPLVAYHENESLRARVEDRGIVLGAPGMGKTSFLIAQLIDWMQTGQSFVATDIKPEIWAILKQNGLFEKYGYTDWVLNPTDINSYHYNIFSEVQDTAELNEVLSIIIKDESGETAVFSENARRLLKAVLMELGDQASLSSAQSYINAMDDNAELLKSLRQSNNNDVSNIAKDITRTAKSENLLASIMTALTKAFDFLDDDRIRKTTSDNADGFYLKDILMQPKQAVFLQFDQQYKNSTSTLFGAMVAHILRILQANQNRGAVFVAFDEIINCPKIPNFKDTLNLIRTAKMPCFLYLQSLEKLNEIYGVNSDRVFMGASNLKIVFQIGDIGTAKTLSETIGKTLAKIYSKSKNQGHTVSSVNDGSQSKSSGDGESWTKAMVNILEHDYFMGIPKYHAVITYSGYVGTLQMPNGTDGLERIKFKNVSEYLAIKNRL